MHVTYLDCVSVALGIEGAMPMRPIVICGQSGCTKFFPHYTINGKIFRKKDLQYKTCVLSFSIISVRKISHSKRNLARHYHKVTLVLT